MSFRALPLVVLILGSTSAEQQQYDGKLNDISLPAPVHVVQSEDRQASAERRLRGPQASRLLSSVVTESQKLVASDGASNDFYGYSASMSGNVLAVGAWKDDSSAGTDVGE